VAASQVDTERRRRPTIPGDDPWRRVGYGIGLVVGVVVAGTVGYVALGFSFLDALYQTVTTISTVGFREVEELDAVGKSFTIVLILVGVGATLYTFSLLLETVVEGRLTDLFGRRRMQRQIAELSGHVIVCGWGRVGRATADAVARGGRDLVVVDHSSERLADTEYFAVHGDATDEAVLRQAGVERAAVVVAAVETDADNLYTTLTCRALNPDAFIVARARQESAEPRLVQAGANRVVNPQKIGGDRMAAFAVQPNVAEFLDVAMHDANLEFRLEEVVVSDGSVLAGLSLRDAKIRERTGALVLAMRLSDGRFHTNPVPSTPVEPGQVLIAIGTPDQLAQLGTAAGRG
jgi:voltage-gated potassium channel